LNRKALLVSLALTVVALVVAAGWSSKSVVTAGSNSAAIFSVKDTSGEPLVGATVFAIPAADVEALAAVPISRDEKVYGNFSAEALTVDEPLEDLINGNFTPAGGGVSTYLKGVTNAEGKAEIASLGANKKFFIYVKPANGDADHLPGGSLTRASVTGASLTGKVVEVKVSTKPSAAATFVGSSACLTCHNEKSDFKKTAHKNGFMAPGAPSGLQDLSKFDADDAEYNMMPAYEKEFTSAGTTVYFYDYDAKRKFDKFKTSETNPDPTGKLGNVWATVKLFKDTDGKYKMTFTNVKNPSDPGSPFTKEVSLTYGGGIYKQRYMTTAGNSIHVLPLQYNSRGDEASKDRVRKQWRDYHMDWWINDPTGTPVFKKQPANNNAVDVQCATCHFNGYSVTKNAAGEFMASGVADPNGEVHPVTGIKQELNIGCETCHGPGSEHVKAGGRGKSIVTPQNLTPERETVICAQCHSRPQGNDSFGIKKDSPLNGENKMMVAGTSRADFLAQNTSRNDSDRSDQWDDELFSKSHHQQYTDFIQSSKYRNGSKLLTCSSCHDLHAPGKDRHQLTGVSDNSLCLSCHTNKKLDQHQIQKTGFNMGNAKCIDCHNVKTANSGAGLNQTGDYLHGDITSHSFAVPDKFRAPMPVPYTSTCAACHQKKIPTVDPRDSKIVSENVTILVNGVKIDSDVSPFINGNERTMVPVRFISEALNYNVDWDSKESIVTVTDGKKTVKLSIDKKIFTINDANKAMDTAAVSLPPGRTMVPVRFVSEALGAKVGWNGNTKTVTITTN
jgi:hypothetical protein